MKSLFTHVVGCGLALVLLTGLAACKKNAPPEVAHIESAPAAATLKRSDGTTVPAAVGTPLYLDDQVINPGEGNVVIWFPGDNRVTIPPQASVAMQRNDASSPDVGPLLLSGSMHAESSGKGKRLSVASPYGFARSGPSMTVLDVSIEKGLSVHVGQVDLEHEGNIETVHEGRTVTINGLNLDLSRDREVAGLKFNLPGPVDPNAPESAPFVLFPKHNPHLKRGKAAAVVVAKRTTLQDGDAVQTAGYGAGSRVVINDLGMLTFGTGTEVEFKQVATRGARTTGDYLVKSGALEVHLVQEADKPIDNTIGLAGAGNVMVEPGLRFADLEVHAGQQPQLALRFGRLRLADTAVEAGSRVQFKDGRPQVGPLADNAVDVFEGRHSVVHYDKVAPPLNFVFDGASHGPARIDIATDSAFKHLVGVEQVSRGSFILDQTSPGATYYWRVDNKPAQGMVQYKPEGETGCRSCKHVNMIEDTGEKTVVYYQQTLPALTFAWKAAEGAASYNLKVFKDGQFDKPLLSDTTDATSRAYPAGRFAEEKYFWLVKPVDAKGHELNPGRMNSLQIAYDNVITALVIRTPKLNAHVSEDAIVTSGEAEIGTKVYCQGDALALDDDGRFSQPIRLRPGVNHLVYRVVGTDKVEHMYTRQVVRGAAR